MSDKHLSKGSKIPPLSKGKLRLYSMRFDPYCQRVHLVLDAKKIPYDVVNVNLTVKPEWLYDKSPLGKVPALELESGDCLYESMIIADYLDEKYPQRPLYPKDPLKKAKDKLLINQFNKVISNLYKLYQNMDKEFLDAVMKAMDVFEREIVSRSKPFFAGDKPGMLDYMIWPWCERSEMLKIMGGDQFVLPRERFLRLMEWRNAMKEEESVKLSYLEPEVHAKYVNSHRAGCADYDLLVKCRYQRGHHIKLTNLASELDTLLGNAFNIVHDQLDYRKMCAGWVSNLTDDHEAHRMELPLTHLTHYASHGEQFLQYIVTGDETFVNHMTLKTSIASVMCKQPSSCPTEKEFKEMP